MEDYDRNHNKKNIEMETAKMNKIKQLLSARVAVFGLIHENKCECGKAITSKVRMDSFDEIATLCEQTGNKTELDENMIRSTKVRWLSYRQVMEGIIYEEK